MKNENAQGQVLEFGAAMLKALPRDMDSITMQGWIKNPKGLNKFLKGLCPPANVANAAEKSGTKYLRLIKDNLVIDSCDGTDTISGSNDMFRSIDPNFVNWNADEPGHPTSESLVNVYELISNANVSDMFGSFGNSGNICLMQAQIKNFIKKHRGWLRADGCATLLPFKSYGKFFVAEVRVYSDGRLYVLLERFDSLSVWRAGKLHRVVVPQLD